MKNEMLREGVKTEDGKGVFQYLEVRGDGTVVENPVKSLALTPISLRGAILLRDGSSLLDCNNIEGRIRI
jgi:hypothetical protein